MTGIQVDDKLYQIESLMGELLPQKLRTLLITALIFFLINHEFQLDDRLGYRWEYNLGDRLQRHPLRTGRMNRGRIQLQSESSRRVESTQ